MTWDRGFTSGGFEALIERLDPSVDAAFRDALEAVSALGVKAEGLVDDVQLLSSILETPDDLLLTILGSHFKKLRGEVDAELASQRDLDALPQADHILGLAATEALSLTGTAAVIEQVHVVLALFSLQGCASEDVLHRCGIDWRPLRSLARRATRRTYDW